MKKYKIFSNQYIKNSLFILIGLLIGWIWFHSSPSGERSETDLLHEQPEVGHSVWTCAMHPQVRLDSPGKCPICGMDLIPVQKSNLDFDQDAIEMSESALKLAEVQTELVKKGIVSKKIMLNGNIEADERLLRSQTSHVSGRIEKLYINVTGENVKKGQLIAKIYSPELVTSQKELLEAKSLENKYPSLVEAAREKLRNLKLSEEQIQGIEKSGIVTSTFDIYANISGIVLNRKVNEGDHVGIGTVLFDVADLTRVWGVFDAYESDLPWIKLGQEIEFSTQAIPGKTFNGKVSFIDPVINQLTRIARIRIELINPNLQLKPGMFVDGILQSRIAGSGESIIIPQSAVLWTGIRSIVYVKIKGTEHPAFRMRQITLGATMDDAYIVLNGLQEGEEIVTNGAFSVDAAAQLAGKKSMMNTEDNSSYEGRIQEKQISDGNQQAQITNLSGKDHTPIPEPEGIIHTDFKKQLQEVYYGYLKIKDALVASNAIQAGTEAANFARLLLQVDMNLVKGKDHIYWMERFNQMKEAARLINQNDQLKNQRQAFSGLTSSLNESIRYFGLINEKIYYQFCPMAIDLTGDYWLSSEEEIRNPYFGDEMLSCGTVEEIIEFKD